MKIMDSVHARGCRFKSGRPRKTKNDWVSTQSFLRLCSAQKQANCLACVGDLKSGAMLSGAKQVS